MSCACIQKGNQEFVRLTDKKRMAFCRFFMLAKQAAYAREAWCICTRFACTGTGRCPDAPGNAAKRQTIVAKATRISAVGGREASKASCKGVKARVACCPDRDMLSMQWKVPERERFYSFCFCKKNQKAAGTPSCDLGSNRRSIHYFGLKFWFSSGNRLCTNHYFAQYRRQ